MTNHPWFRQTPRSRNGDHRREPLCVRRSKAQSAPEPRSVSASAHVDIIGMPFTPLSFAGVARRTARRAYWYGAAAAPYGYAYPALYPYAAPYPYHSPYYPPY
jgi:hypothetical protein